MIDDIGRGKFLQHRYHVEELAVDVTKYVCRAIYAHEIRFLVK